jgi:hypothetical protein
VPVPGPRAQRAPLPGYRNPEGETPTRINHWLYPKPVYFAGQTPGTKIVFLGGFRLAAGQIRRLWKPMVNQIIPATTYNQTTLSPSPDVPRDSQPPVEITRGYRYMVSTRNQGSGDNLTYWGAHSVVPIQQVKPTVTRGHGGRNRPTVRNRLTSFGSRVPTLNGPVEGAQS